MLPRSLHELLLRAPLDADDDGGRLLGLLPRYRIEEQARHTLMVARVILESEQASSTPVRAALLTTRELRGWPCAGRGIAGEVAGTRPGTGPSFEDE